MKYIRFFQEGGTYFFTAVTFNRRKIFNTELNCNFFHQAVEKVCEKHPFEVIAYCICPDHIHMIWTLPQDNSDYPTRWRLIKSYFSRKLNDPEDHALSQSRMSKGEKNIWQRRYWEHYIKDETDLKNYIEYIHYNPVKHHYAKSPISWKDSSFSDYVNEGLYDRNWGNNERMNYLDKFGKE